ncbi:TPA: hypothetical protein ACWSAQ_005261, partial [Escherichia coli]
MNVRNVKFDNLSFYEEKIRWR